MPSKSTTSVSPSFKTEAEEADWYASPEGRRFTSRAFQKAIREGKIIASSSTKPPSKELTNEALRSGSVIFYTKGMKFQPTDPAVLEKLLDDTRASMTKAISLRIPTIDIEAAKAIGKRKGVGYQTVLKQAIRKGLASSLR